MLWRAFLQLVGLKSRPRQRADYFKSSITPILSDFSNPAHGSERMLQVFYNPNPKRLLQSRPRQWADCSGPFYHSRTSNLNPAHGSGRIVQVLSTIHAPRI